MHPSRAAAHDNHILWPRSGRNYIQFCYIIGIRIDLENATKIWAKWRTVNNTIVSHGTFIPTAKYTKVRSNFSHGFIDWIELPNSTSSERNAVNGAVGCGQSSRIFMTLSCQLLANERYYRIIHWHGSAGLWITDLIFFMDYKVL